MNKMTPEQALEFCSWAQMGIALGLTHRYEWFVGALRCLGHLDYSTMEESRAKIESAFVEFERNTCSCPEEEEELDNLTVDGYYERVNSYYDRALPPNR
jgi:hypothetical protein